jgi:hypothetical protein
MGRVASLTRRVSGIVKAGGILAAAWAFLLWGLDPIFGLLHWLNRVAHGTAWLHWSRFHERAITDAIHWTHTFQNLTLFGLVMAMSVAVPLGMLARTVARARLRAGFADPLDRVREWTAAHAWTRRVILAVPALGWLALWTWVDLLRLRDWGDATMYGEFAGTPIVRAMYVIVAEGTGVFWCGAAVMALGIYALGGLGLRALLAPTLAGESEEPLGDEAGDRLHFDAVAVTAETRGAVVAMALLPFVALFLARGLGQAGTEAVLAGYTATAVAGVLAFRRASRIAIGVDGVYVSGSSRARFFSYASLDAVRADGNNLELVRHGKVVLRLQLHGRDASQQAAILSRIQESIARSRAGESRAAGQVVHGATEGQLARLAGGGADYRAPAVTREQLWALVEGPEHDQATREAAAKALAKTGDPEERARLRVAADHHAEPRSRVALKELASQAPDEAEEEDEVDSEPQARRTGAAAPFGGAGAMARVAR